MVLLDTKQLNSTKSKAQSRVMVAVWETITVLWYSQRSLFGFFCYRPHVRCVTQFKLVILPVDMFEDKTKEIKLNASVLLLADMLICGSVILCRHVALFWRICTEDVGSRTVRNFCVYLMLVHTAEVRNFVIRRFSRCYGNYMRKVGRKGQAVHSGVSEMLIDCLQEGLKENTSWKTWK
jgi:hypothetical protein